MNTKKRIDIVNEVQNIPENKERTLEVLHDIVFKDRARHVISILETHEGHLSFLYTGDTTNVDRQGLKPIMTRLVTNEMLKKIQDSTIQDVQSILRDVKRSR